MSNHSSHFPSCFLPSTTVDHHPSHVAPPPPPPNSGNTNLTTNLFHTDLGLFSLTWSRSLLGRSLHLHLHFHPFAGPTTASAAISPLSLSTFPQVSSSSFHLHIKSFMFWKKQGSKKLTTGGTKIQVFWDLTRAKFGSGPEPQSGFYIAVAVAGKMIHLAGDSTKGASNKTKAQKLERDPILVLRREHVFGNKIYTTKAKIRGKNRDITIDCTLNEDAKLYFSVDNKRVLQIKRLKWKFRGNERIEVDGVPIQVSWDVYNWLFDDTHDGHGVFMFRFEEEQGEKSKEDGEIGNGKNEVDFCNFGMDWRKMMRKSSSSSMSMSMSSASSGCSSSVLEWASTEEDELRGLTGFSLLVYAWRSSCCGKFKA